MSLTSQPSAADTAQNQSGVHAALSRHTAAPWRAQRTAVYDAIYGPNGEIVCFVATRETQEARANARLIAAAPELLQALQIAATTLETVYRERDPKNVAAKCAAERARAAIAKAGGAL